MKVMGIDTGIPGCTNELLDVLVFDMIAVLNVPFRKPIIQKVDLVFILIQTNEEVLGLDVSMDSSFRVVVI